MGWVIGISNQVSTKFPESIMGYARGECKCLNASTTLSIKYMIWDTWTQFKQLFSPSKSREEKDPPQVDILQHKIWVLNMQAIIGACHLSNFYGGPLKQPRNSTRRQTVRDSTHSYKFWANLRFVGEKNISTKIGDSTLQNKYGGLG